MKRQRYTVEKLKCPQLIGTDTQVIEKTDKRKEKLLECINNICYEPIRIPTLKHIPCNSLVHVHAFVYWFGEIMLKFSDELR